MGSEMCIRDRLTWLTGLIVFCGWVSGLLILFVLRFVVLAEKRVRSGEDRLLAVEVVQQRVLRSKADILVRGSYVLPGVIGAC